MNHGDQSGQVNLGHYPFFGAEEAAEWKPHTIGDR